MAPKHNWTSSLEALVLLVCLASLGGAREVEQRASDEAAVLPLTLDESEARWQHVRATTDGRYCFLSVSALAEEQASRCSLRWEEIEVGVATTTTPAEERVQRATRNDTRCSAAADETCGTCHSQISSLPLADPLSLEDWYRYCRNVCCRS